jgi:hypothetical protein
MKLARGEGFAPAVAHAADSSAGTITRASFICA